MLVELHIEALGVIEELDLVLGPGLTALTGETGAGKTMLVEAISLLVGGRADPGIVRPGAAEARVEGRFVLDGEELVVSRVVPSAGRSRAYIDGRLATAAQLNEVGVRSVDLHGQHSHQSLLGMSSQRAALDRFGDVDLTPLLAARRQIAEVERSLSRLGGDARARARELDLLHFQLDELDRAAIADEHEDERLAIAHDTLADVVAHREAGARAIAELSGDGGVAERLGDVVHLLGDRAPFAAAGDRLEGLVVELSDVLADLRSVEESLDDDPEKLATMRDRLHLLRDLRRKYGDSLADVIAFHAEIGARLAEVQGHEGRVAELEAQRAAVGELERIEAGRVGAARRVAAAGLATRVQSNLRRLAMPHAELAIVVGADDPGDDVAFELAANPGAPLAPLARVASGGELARTMLALRLVLSEAPDTLVFDEVDAGIGGDAAAAVGDALARLGGRHQVLVVTHLAQVAARADAHVVLSKQVRNGTTTATARVVEGEARTDEIARMLSGHAATEPARRHAAELLVAGRRL